MKYFGDLTFIVYIKGLEIQLLDSVDFNSHTRDRKYMRNVGHYLTLAIL